MLRPAALADLYFWTLVFDDGHVVTQLDNNKRRRSERIDVNCPPASLGQPFLIVLTPRRSFLPLAYSPIPAGCRPVYAGVTTMQGSEPVRFVYRVGYASGRHRVYKTIDPETGKVACEEDYEG